MLNKLRLRLRALFFKSKMEEELDEEAQFHLEREIEENIARGMSPEEARYAAMRSFGGVERVKEESRDERGIRLLEEVWQDLRYGARMLLKQPGFTLIAALTLALGIGANTAIFSVINALILNPPHIAEAERVEGMRVTANFLSLLKVKPLRGRDFRVEEEKRGAEGVVIIGHQFWQNRLGGSDAALGRRLDLNGKPFTIIGVLPPGFEFPLAPKQ